MSRLALLVLVLKRLRSRPVLPLLVVLSIALAIAVAVGASAFAGSVSRAMMQQELQARTAWTHRPALSVRFYAVPTVEHPLSWEQVLYTQRWLASALSWRVGLRPAGTYVQMESPWMSLGGLSAERASLPDQGETRVICVDDIGAHIRIVEGEPYDSAQPGDALPVWVYLSLANERGYRVGERYALHERSGEGSVQVRIAGLWEAADERDPYWYQSPYGLLGKELLTTPEAYEQRVAPLFAQGADFAFWYYRLDDRHLDLGGGERIIAGFRSVALDVARRLPGGRMDYAPLEELQRGKERKDALAIVLYACTMPLLIILVLFAGSLSAIAVRQREHETAMLASRGASRQQVIALALVEALVLLALACPLGAWLGLRLARLLSHARAFLSFQPTPALGTPSAVVDWGAVSLVALASLLARLWPTWRASRLSLVTSERWLGRQQGVWRAGRLLLGLALAGLTWYTYRQLRVSTPLALFSWQPGHSLPADPLLLLAPTLYLLCAPMLAGELFVLLVRPLGWLSKLSPWPSLVLSGTSLGREGQRYALPVFLLTLCLSVGVFYASLARSADQWLVDRRHYQAGADLSFEPGSLELEEGVADSEIWSLPISQYRQVPGVSEVARVADYPARVLQGQGKIDLRLLGVDQASLGRVVWFRVDLATEGLGELLNRLSDEPRGILISERLASTMQLQEGDPLPLYVLAAHAWHPLTLRVVGTYRFFPTVYEERSPAVVTNLELLESELGGWTEHRIWMRLTPGATGDSVLQAVRAMGVLPKVPQDAAAWVKEDLASLERVGIMGTMSLGFLAGAWLAAVDLGAYHVDALRRRASQFAILRAMGLSRLQLLGAVVSDYLVVAIWGLFAGAGLGAWGAHLYVPFLPLTHSAEVMAPPFVALMDWPQVGGMALGIGAALVTLQSLSLLALGRQRLFEAIRLPHEG